MNDDGDEHEGICTRMIVPAVVTVLSMVALSVMSKNTQHTSVLLVLMRVVVNNSQ